MNNSDNLVKVAQNPIHRKISWFFIIGAISLVALLVPFSFVAFQELTMSSASQNITSVGEIIRVHLTESMVNGTIDKRKNFFDRIKEENRLKKIEVRRSPSVIQQFGPGDVSEQNPDELEAKVLVTGKAVFLRDTLADGTEIVRGVIPYIANKPTKENHPNCMNCHNVKTGDVLGAISIVMDINKMVEQSNRTIAIITCAVAGLMIFMLLFAHKFLGNPLSKIANEITNSVKSALRGNFTTKISGSSNDELGIIAKQLNYLFMFLNLGLTHIERQTLLLTRKNPVLGKSDNLLTSTLEQVNALVRISDFKQAIAEDESKHDVYVRLANTLHNEFGIREGSIYELSADKLRLEPIFISDNEAFVDLVTGESSIAYGDNNDNDADADDDVEYNNGNDNNNGNFIIDANGNFNINGNGNNNGSSSNNNNNKNKNNKNCCGKNNKTCQDKDGACSNIVSWCKTSIFENANMCRLVRTGHSIDGLYDSKICTTFQPICGLNSTDSKPCHKRRADRFYLCLPIFRSTGLAAVVQIVVPKNKVEALQKKRPLIEIYLKEMQPVIESKHLLEGLKNATLHDTLTKLKNRRFLDEYLETLNANISRNKTKMTILALDVDHFKMVNDTYGHDAGDMVLKFVADALKKSVRQTDFVVRTGGEEFLVLLMNSELEQGLKIAEKIRSNIESSSIKINNTTSLKKTISIGAVEYPQDFENLDFGVAVKHADIALYQAKKTGRNKVVTYSEDNPDNAEAERETQKG